MTETRRERARQFIGRVRSEFGRRPVYYLLLAGIVVLVVGKSVTIAPRLDRWSYAAWYIEDYLLANGRLPTCEQVLSTGNYRVYWNKTCTRIDAPVQAILTVAATHLTGLDFTGEWRRWFLLTPALKLAGGYALASLYTKRPSLRAFGAVAVFLVPDYFAVYLTQAKGISLPLLLWGYYFAIRWNRDDRRWFGLAILSLAVLAVTYFPRALILGSSLVVIAGVRVVTDDWHPYRLVRVVTVVMGVFYLTRFQTVLEQLGGIFSSFSSESIAMTIDVFLNSLIGSGEPVPFALSTPPYGVPILVTLTLLGISAWLNALRRERLGLLVDERMLLIYGICLTYIPPAFTLGFFYSRILFEGGIIAVLMAVGELDNVWGNLERTARSASRLSFSGRTVAAGILVVILLCNLLILPPPTGEGYQTDSYQTLHSELGDAGIDRDAAIFTDMRTGAYLVGEYQYRNVSHVVDARNRLLLVDIWYGDDPVVTCGVLTERYDARYFIRNDIVHRSHLGVLNYPRVPINESAYLKFDRSPAFVEVTSTGPLTVYRLDQDCASGGTEGGRRR